MNHPRVLGDMFEAVMVAERESLDRKARDGKGEKTQKNSHVMDLVKRASHSGPIEH